MARTMGNCFIVCHRFISIRCAIVILATSLMATTFIHVSIYSSSNRPNALMNERKLGFNYTCTNTPNQFTIRTVFLYSTYVLPDNRLRIIAVHYCLDSNNTQSYTLTIPLLDGSTIQRQANIKTIYDGCYYVTCGWDGIYLDFTLPENADLQNSHGYSLSSGGRRTCSIPALLQQPQRDPPHTLVACVAPMYLNADWIELVQFIESWLQLGTTKFFIYIHSIAPEVDYILSLYEKDGTVERRPIPLFPWPENANGSLNPNEQFYLAGQIVANNDCIHRTQYVSKFVTFMDFDEIVIIHRGAEKIIDFVQDLNEKNPNAGSFLFPHSFIHFGMPSDSPMGMELQSVDFSYLNTVHLLGDVSGLNDWPCKVIVRPERVDRMRIHVVMEYAAQKYNTVFIDPQVARLYHYQQMGRSQNANVHPFFTTLIPKMSNSWRSRLKNYSVESRKLQYRASAALSQAQQCLPHRNHPTKCRSPGSCLKGIRSVYQQEWVFGSNQSYWRLLG